VSGPPRTPMPPDSPPERSEPPAEIRALCVWADSTERLDRFLADQLGLSRTLTARLIAEGAVEVNDAVADRRKELGLRMALGADGGRVLGMILRQSLVTVILGLAVGLGGAWAGTRLLEAFLFETSARDPRAFAGAAALLFTVVLVASYLPARRATRVDPVEALRAE